jgi:hypothetical protein
MDIATPKTMLFNSHIHDMDNILASGQKSSLNQQEPINNIAPFSALACPLCRLSY